ncbi:MAG: peptidylprolyl isomerase [Clostridia bacterium]|nr:peptidylprolyl isomerase [Clostridia bacterium]
MKFFNKMFLSIFTVCIMAFTFAGCSLVELNTEKYYQEKVALYDNKISVDTRELLNGYYNFGNANYDGSGDPTVAGLESTIDQLLNRKILIDALKTGNKDAGVPKVVLTTAQINTAWDSVYEYINGQISDIETALREEAEDPFVTGEDETETKETYENEYTAYQPTYEIQNGDLVKIDQTTYIYDAAKNTITKQEKAEEVANYSTDIYGISETELNEKTYRQKAELAYNNFRAEYWEHTDSIEVGASTAKTSYSDKAFSKFIENLKATEKGMNKSTIKEEIFYREVERLFEIYYDNQFLSAYQEYYSANDVITADMVTSKYTKLAQAQQETYTANETVFTGVMQGGATGLYYENGSSDWFKVSHVLIKFDDKQSAQLTNLKTQLDNGKISKENYLAQVETIKLKTIATDRATGKTYSVDQVLQNLQDELYGKDEYTKMAIFKDYIYRFNMDDGVNNAETCYYIPTDSANDQMVKEFANASREARKGSVGTISGLVESTYGYHIIMYLGERTSLPEDGTVSVVELSNFYLNPLNNKTMLDKVIEQIAISNYASHEKSLLAQIKSGKETVYYKGAYEKLLG